MSPRPVRLVTVDVDRDPVPTAWPEPRTTAEYEALSRAGQVWWAMYWRSLRPKPTKKPRGGKW